MNTLQEIATFTGQHPLSMHAVGELIPSFTELERTSMQAMILGLQRLPPITLEAEAVGDRFGNVPFSPIFHIEPSGGVVLDTRMALPGVEGDPEVVVVVGDSGNFAPITVRRVGIFLYEIRRRGITSTGFTTLRKDFFVEGVEPPPPPPPPPLPPTIAVKTNKDGSFVVSGSGFARGKPISIRAQDQVNPQNQRNFVATASPTGVLVDFPTGAICVVPGGQITFSAQDGTLDPSNHSPVISNFVTVTCPLK